jgi:hypothetical protein
MPGLINQLEKNLRLQESGKCGATDLYFNDPTTPSGKRSFCFVTNAGLLGYQDDQLAFPNTSGASLATVFVFDIFNDVTISPITIEKHNRFKALASFPLFTCHTTYGSTDNGENLVVYEYAINFGRDVEGTARLISEISNKVFDYDLGQPLDCFTGEYEEILKHRKALGLGTSEEDGIETSEEDGIETSEEDGINWKKWIWIGISIIGGLIYLFS